MVKTLWCHCYLSGDGFYKVSESTCCELCDKFISESGDYLVNDLHKFFIPNNKNKKFLSNEEYFSLKSKERSMRMTANQARYNRNRKIQSAVKRGQSLRQVAAEYGLHHKSVWRIVNFGKNVSFV